MLKGSLNYIFGIASSSQLRFRTRLSQQERLRQLHNLPRNPPANLIPASPSTIRMHHMPNPLSNLALLHLDPHAPVPSRPPPNHVSNHADATRLCPQGRIARVPAQLLAGGEETLASVVAGLGAPVVGLLCATDDGAAVEEARDDEAP